MIGRKGEGVEVEVEMTGWEGGTEEGARAEETQ